MLLQSGLTASLRGTYSDQSSSSSMAVAFRLAGQGGDPVLHRVFSDKLGSSDFEQIHLISRRHHFGAWDESILDTRRRYLQGPSLAQGRLPQASYG